MPLPHIPNSRVYANHLRTSACRWPVTEEVIMELRVAFASRQADETAGAFASSSNDGSAISSSGSGNNSGKATGSIQQHAEHADGSNASSDDNIDYAAATAGPALPAIDVANRRPGGEGCTAASGAGRKKKHKRKAAGNNTAPATAADACSVAPAKSAKRKRSRTGDADAAAAVATAPLTSLATNGAASQGPQLHKQIDNGGMPSSAEGRKKQHKLHRNGQHGSKPWSHVPASGSLGSQRQ